MVGGAALGSAMNASSQFEDALNNGATLQKAFDAANLGGIVGMSEVVPIMSVLNRVNKATGGPGSKRADKRSAGRH